MTDAECRRNGADPSTPNEPLRPPKRLPKYSDDLEKALASGTAGATEIRAALAREPERSQLM